MGRNKNNNIKIVCNKLKPDGKGNMVVCGSTEHILSGKNTWATIIKATTNKQSVKVLRQRLVCKGCGQFNYTHLDGTPIKEDYDYSDYEIQKLINLTKKKQEENNTEDN